MEDLSDSVAAAVPLLRGTGHQGMQAVLDALAVFAAASISRSTRGEAIEAAITLHWQHRRSVGGSTSVVRLIEEAEQSRGDGPGFFALEAQSRMLIGDTRKGSRWGTFSDFLEAEGYRSVLAVPIPAVPEASAVLCLFSRSAGAFNSAEVSAAEDFAEHAGLTLRHTMASTVVDNSGPGLRRAAETRRTVDLACGAIMAQNRCSQTEALQALIDASRNRKQEILLVAEEFLHSLVMGHER